MLHISELRNKQATDEFLLNLIFSPFNWSFGAFCQIENLECYKFPPYFSLHQSSLSLWLLQAELSEIPPAEFIKQNCLRIGFTCKNIMIFWEYSKFAFQNGTK